MSDVLSDEYMAKVIAEMNTPAAKADAERAPLPPPDAIELLRATGCPIVRRKNTEAAA